MLDQPSRKKNRVPLSREELYYFKKLKQLKHIENIEHFKQTALFKIISAVNIIVAAFLMYCILSVLLLSSWQKTSINYVNITLGETDLQTHQRPISTIDIETTSGEKITINTYDLYTAPTINQELFLGKDFLFKKLFKVKFSGHENIFWNINAYASLTVCVFSLLMGCFIYAMNRHLYINGLLTVLGLFLFACLYFLLI